jgi:hypothetical protein
MKPPITRRSFMAGASAGALVAGFPPLAGAQQAVTVDQFLAISSRLTEAATTDLDSTMAAKLLDGFISTGRGSGLSLLAEDATLRVGTVADDIVAAWYSGLYDTATGPAVAGFNEALLWNALDFTKPPGTCGGETGYWADPPQG